MGKPPFDRIVTSFGAVVLRVCRASLRPTDADDAWSETFLSALQAYPELPPDANVEAWLVTIAHRKVIDLLRASSRRPEPVAELPEQVDDRGFEADLDDRAEVAGALGSLTLHQRQVLVYHYLIGLPYTEVAQVVGSSPAAVRRAAADGIAKLRARHGAELATKGLTR